MIKAVIFDWGGVMSVHGQPTAFRENLAKALGRDPEYARSILRVGIHELLRGTITEADFWRKLEAAHGALIPPASRDIFNGWDILAPDPRMTNVVDGLKARGFKVALLSNLVPDTEQLFQEHHVQVQFDQVVLSTQAHLAKPDPGIYELMLKKLSLPATECLYIDDQQRMLDQAAALGMRTILAQDPDNTIKEIEHELKS